jgi:magnesium chelatase subunit H
MLKRTSAPDLAPIRVAIVTMDGNLAGAMARAKDMLKPELPSLVLTMHTADEWADDKQALAACLDDIAKADILFVGMMFLEDHYRLVLPAIEARKDDCDAVVCCLSAAEVMRNTRAGRFKMSGSAGGAIGLLKRLRGGTKSGSSGHGQMKMLKQLPKLLRFIPGTAQDVRAYFLILQYWLAGSDVNLANMVRLLVSRYAQGPRKAAAALLRPGLPIDYPDIGLYHPRAKGRIVDQLKDLPKGGTKGTVGLLVLRSYLLSDNAAHYDGAIAALEARGLNVVTAFASGLDQRGAIERYFIKNGVPTIDALVSLTGFSLVGGPAFNDSKAAEDMLAKLDVPYVLAHPVEFQTLEQWEDDGRGLMPVESTMMVALPELDGAIAGMTYGGRTSRSNGDSRRNMVVHQERANMLAARVAKLVALRRVERANRKIAIVLFNFPPNAGAVGTAAFLAVFDSLHRTLTALKQAGYKVDFPDTVEKLRTSVVEGNANRFGMEANVAARIPVDDHIRRERHLESIEAQWGPAPGRQLADGASLFVLGETFGNVFVGLQPSFGYEGDPMRMLFAKGFSPTHAFSAFYRYIREDFGAHAVLHFGTHGALEFMPGKQVGLSEECWPDRLISDLPNFNLYASNNPSEGTIAKRRASATLISYLTPPVVHAGLYRGLVDLKQSLERWRADSTIADHPEGLELAALIQSQASALDLTAADPVWESDLETRVEALRRQVIELETTLIPFGLHVIGKPPSDSERAEMLDAAGIVDPIQRREMDDLLAKDHELPAIIHALDGRFIRPAPGGDLLRSADVLPTGRNLHGFDPFKLPSAFAVQDAARQADRLLARHTGDGSPMPETIAMVLWGTDNLKTEGGPIAQALWLMGAEPRHDSYGRLSGARLLPLDVLGRPRIDVIVTLSGIFRDLLPLQTKLLAEAALLAANADEPIECNFIRKHVLAFQAENGGSIEDAALRVFGNADGAYGGNVNLLVGSGRWSEEDELADAFEARKGFAYGVSGKPQRSDKVMRHVLASVDVAYQNLDSVEVGVTTVDHYYDSLGGIARAVQRAKGSAATVYIGDQTRTSGTVRTLSEQVALETRSRALNPKFIEGLLEHGYEGVRELEAHVTNTLGWSATTGQVAPWVYQQLTQTLMMDGALRERMAALNATAASKIAERLIEATERRYWSPDDTVMQALRRAAHDLEDRMEGITVGAAA